MVDNLKRIREPLAWGLIGAAVASMLLSLAQAALAVNRSQDDSFPFWLSGVRVAPYELVLALVLAVWGCAVAPAVPRARGIALTAAVVASVGTIVTAVLMALAVIGVQDLVQVVAVFAAGALDLLIGILGSVALWALARPVRLEADEPAAIPAGPTPAEADAPAEGPASVWGRNEAVGAVWRTADEAAAGAPGSSALPTDPPEEADVWRPPPR